MKTSILQSNLHYLLQTVSNAVESRTTLPILANVLLQFKDGLLKATCTDLEVEQIATIEVISCDEDFSITVPVRKLMDIIKSMKGDAVINLTFSDDKLTVSSGRSRYKLTTLPAQDFPNIEDIKASQSFSIDAQKLHQLLSKSSFSMANQDVRYYLNGLCMNLVGETLELVATDGHRLAIATGVLDVPTNENMNIIIPRKAVLILQKMLGGLNSVITIELSNNHIRLIMNNGTFTSKLVDGRFPDYNRVIPKDGSEDIVVQFDSATLKNTLSSVSILANEKFKGIRFNFTNGLLKLTASNPQEEQSEEFIDCDFQGQELEFGMNVGYIIDAIQNISSGNISLHLKPDPTASVRMYPTGNQNVLSVLMPMRL